MERYEEYVLQEGKLGGSSSSPDGVDKVASLLDFPGTQVNLFENACEDVVETLGLPRLPPSAFGIILDFVGSKNALMLKLSSIKLRFEPKP